MQIQATNSLEENEVTFNVRIEKADENANCIRIEKVSGDKMRFFEIFNELKEKLTELNAIIN